MSRVDQYQVHLVSENGRDCGLWQTFDGGGVDSEEAFDRPAFGLPREALGGPATVQNFTMTRTYRVGRDPELYPLLRSVAGRMRFNASVQLLDLDGHPVGPIEPYTGILKSVSKDSVDIEGSDAMKLTVEFTAG